MKIRIASTQEVEIKTPFYGGYLGMVYSVNEEGVIHVTDSSIHTSEIVSDFTARWMIDGTIKTITEVEFWEQYNKTLEVLIKKRK